MIIKWLREQYNKIINWLSKRKKKRIREEEYRKLVRAEFEKTAWLKNIRREERERVRKKYARTPKKRSKKGRVKSKSAKDVWKSLEELDNKFNNMF